MPTGEPHAASARAIREAAAAGAAGGYFRFPFRRRAQPSETLPEACIAWRCRLSMVYGDQGIFVTRAAYDASPGIGAQPLFEGSGAGACPEAHPAFSSPWLCR